MNPLLTQKLTMFCKKNKKLPSNSRLFMLLFAAQGRSFGADLVPMYRYLAFNSRGRASFHDILRLISF